MSRQTQTQRQSSARINELKRNDKMVDRSGWWCTSSYSSHLMLLLDFFSLFWSLLLRRTFSLLRGWVCTTYTRECLVYKYYLLDARVRMCLCTSTNHRTLCSFFVYSLSVCVYVCLLRLLDVCMQSEHTAVSVMKWFSVSVSRCRVKSLVVVVQTNERTTTQNREQGTETSNYIGSRALVWNSWNLGPTLRRLDIWDRMVVCMRTHNILS